ncbi:MAG: VWA domain-containing protein, partial [candidate division Zixibacteria bacterium]|nr:VWA domain-containing protein [candidate division Zixibacteria bacterium]
MFNFLNPIFLFAAGAAVLFPLLIHLFNRQKVKKVYFSSLLFLRSLEKTRMRRVKIKEYLLLLIRSLVILLVVAAFARPALRGGFASKVGAHAKTSIVILLDNSYSMRYETKEGSLFDLAKKKAIKIISQLKEGDEAGLILFASEPELTRKKPTYDFKGLLNQLDESLPSYKVTDIGSALKKAFEILKDSKNLNQETYLISDMEKSGWYFADKSPPSLEGKGAKLYLLNVWSEERQNLCIEKIDFGNQLIEKGRPFQIKAQVANFTSQPVKSLLVGLYLDGRRVNQTDIDIERGGKATVEFMQTVETAGIHTGFFEITDDDLMIDNRRYFAFKIPEKIEVLLVGEHQRNTHHLRLALNPQQKSDVHMVVSEADRKSLAGIDFNKYKVIIFSNLSRLSDVGLTNLERFVKRGGGVLFILGNNVEPEFYAQRIFKRFFDLDLKAPLTPTKNVGGFFTLEKIDWNHPIFQVYQNVEKKFLPQIKFSSLFELPQRKNMKVISRFNLGKPALIEKDLGSGKVMLFATSLDEKESDLVIHPFFIPFVNRTVEYLASDLSRLSEDFLVGSKIERELDQKLSREKIKLVDPENQQTHLAPIIQKDKLMLKIQDTEKPGIYKIKTEEKSGGVFEVADRFAVNIDPKDSDPQKIEKSEIKKKLEGLS